MRTLPNITNRRYHRYFVDLKALYQKREIVVYTGLILSLFAIAFFGLFALRPTLITIATLYREIQDKRKTEQTLQAKINNLRLAQVNYAQVANSVQLVNQALPADAAIAEIVYPFEILAQRNSLSLTSVNFTPVDIRGKSQKPKTAVKDTSASIVGFDLVLKGDFANFQTFLSSLENLRRIMAIDRFSLKQNKTEEGDSVMSLNLTGRAFYLSKE